MFSPVRAHVDPNKWCYVIVLALEASKRDPNPDHCAKILRVSLKEMLYINNTKGI